MESNLKSTFYTTNQQRVRGLTGSYSKKQQSFLKIVTKHFKPLSKPIQGDWLKDHSEKGQSFMQYIEGRHHQSKSDRNVIYILPLEPQITQTFLQDLKTYCQCFYFGLKICVLKSSSKTLFSITSRVNSGTKQYHAGQILQKLKKQLPKDAFCMIGVCLADLYPRPSWNFVFGLATLQGRTGVFSFARHDERFYQGQKYQINYERILWKSIGTLVHEIGHMFGLKHCVYYECLMNGSNSSQQASKKPLQLCPICLKKLQSNIKFDIKQRYKNILEFMEKKKSLSQNKKSTKTYELLKSILADFQNIVIQDSQKLKITNKSIDNKRAQNNMTVKNMRGKTTNKLKGKY